MTKFNFHKLNQASKSLLVLTLISTASTYFFLFLFFSYQILDLRRNLYYTPSPTIAKDNINPDLEISIQVPENSRQESENISTTSTPQPTPTPIPTPTPTPESENQSSSTPTPTPTPTPDPIFIPIATISPVITLQEPDSPILSLISESFPFLSMKVTEVKVYSDGPEEINACPISFTTRADITVNRAGDVTYQWHHNNGSQGQETINFPAAGTQTVSHIWILETSGDYFTEIEILEPNSIVSDRTFRYMDCP